MAPARNNGARWWSAEGCALYRQRAALRNWNESTCADRIYLDHAATTPMLPAARAAMAEAMARWANPSSPHAEGRAARAALEEARARIAAAYGWARRGDLHQRRERGAGDRAGAGDGRAAAGLARSSMMRCCARRRGARCCRSARTGWSIARRSTRRWRAGRALVAIQCGEQRDRRASSRSTAIAERCTRRAGCCWSMPRRCRPAKMRAAATPISIARLGAQARRAAGHRRAAGARSRDADAERRAGAGLSRRAPRICPARSAIAAALEREPDGMIALRDQRLRRRLDDAIVARAARSSPATRRGIPTIGSYRMPGVAAAAQLIRFDMAGSRCRRAAPARRAA